MIFTWKAWAPYFLFIAIGVPWHWRLLWGEDDVTLWFGMPAWTVTAIVTSFAASCYTAWLLHWRWPDEEADRQKAASLSRSTGDDDGA